MRPRFVLWDLDGTLADTLGDIAAAANHARHALGFAPLPVEEVRSYVGEGAPRLMQQVMGPHASAEVHAAALEEFHRYYRANVCVTAKPFPGIDRLVRGLAGRQSICTNKPGPTARALVSALGWDGLFVDVFGSGEGGARKPAPDVVFHALGRVGVPVDEAVFVGDSPIDVDTARAAHLAMVCVTWGMRPREEVSAAPVRVDDADTLATHLPELR